MTKLNLSRMDVGSRSRESSTRATGRKRFEGKKSPAKISWSFSRNVGGSRGSTSMACCSDQGGEEAREFSDR
jgi:hypothetical protein